MFPEKVPQPSFLEDLWTESVKITVSDIHNRLKYCVILVGLLHTQSANVAMCPGIDTHGLQL
jgi:hypothetical protein